MPADALGLLFPLAFIVMCTWGFAATGETQPPHRLAWGITLLATLLAGILLGAVGGAHLAWTP